VLREIEAILNMAGTEMAARGRRDREGALDLLSKMSLSGAAAGGGVRKRLKSKAGDAQRAGGVLTEAAVSDIRLPAEPEGEAAPWLAPRTATASACATGCAT
jgi:hypothetical protein